MKKLLFVQFTIFVFCALMASSCVDAVAQEEPRASQHAVTMQRIGLTDITIDYHRPGVKGRAIWGELLPYGMVKSRDGNDIPWRAGANENTTFETSKAIKVEGQDLPAGKYGLHMIPGEEEWVVIFSSNNSSWGSYSYKQSEDVLRVTVKSVPAAHQEWLSYEFDDLTANSATVSLHWAELRVPFKVQTTE